MGEFSSVAYVIGTWGPLVTFYRLTFIVLIIRRLSYSYPLVARALTASNRFLRFLWRPLTVVIVSLLRPLFWLCRRVLWPALLSLLQPLLARLWLRLYTLLRLPATAT